MKKKRWSIVLLIGQTVFYQTSAMATNTLSEAYRAEGARLYQQGKLEDANRLYAKALVEANSLGSERITLEQATMMTEWAQVESKLAEEYGRKAEQESGDPQSPWYGQQQNMLSEAVSHLEVAVNVQEGLLGTNNATCAKTLDTLGTVRLSRKEFAVAESVFRKALAIREANFGANSPDIGYELWQLAKISINGPRFDEATQLCKRALPLLNKAYGAGNSASMQCTLTLAEGLFGLKKFEEAEIRAQECVDYWKRNKGNEYSLTKTSRQLLEDIVNAMADNAQIVLRKQVDKLSPGDPKLIPFIERWQHASAKAGRKDDVELARQWLVGMTTNASTPIKRNRKN